MDRIIRALISRSRSSCSAGKRINVLVHGDTWHEHSPSDLAPRQDAASHEFEKSATPQRVVALVIVSLRFRRFERSS